MRHWICSLDLGDADNCLENRHGFAVDETRGDESASQKDTDFFETPKVRPDFAQHRFHIVHSAA